MTQISELSLIAAALSTGTVQNWEAIKDDPHFYDAFYDWADEIVQTAEDYEFGTSEMTTTSYGLDSLTHEYVDPILAVIVSARKQRDHAERVLKLSIAYARSCPRPYPLRTIAECAKMAPSTVAGYVRPDDQAEANEIVQEVRNSLPALFSRCSKE